MKRPAILLAAIVFCVIGSIVYADYAFTNEGTWPKSWPAEMEPLRKHARTFEGPHLLYRHYSIPFSKREEFEAAWPYLVKAKTKGAPIFLVRSTPRTNFFGVEPAGVLIESPPADLDRRAHPEAPLSGDMDPWTRWSNTTFIYLVVDGNIVDLNRIALPPDTPIIDERFKAEAPKAGDNRPAVPPGADAPTEAPRPAAPAKQYPAEPVKR